MNEQFNEMAKKLEERKQYDQPKAKEAPKVANQEGKHTDNASNVK